MSKIRELIATSEPVESGCTVLLDIVKTSLDNNINDIMARVKSELDQQDLLNEILELLPAVIQLSDRLLN